MTRWNLYTDAARTVSAAATRIYFVEPGQKTILTLDPPVFDASQVPSRRAAGAAVRQGSEFTR